MRRWRATDLDNMEAPANSPTLAHISAKTLRRRATLWVYNRTTDLYEPVTPPKRDPPATAGQTYWFSREQEAVRDGLAGTARALVFGRDYIKKQNAPKRMKL